MASSSLSYIRNFALLPLETWTGTRLGAIFHPALVITRRLLLLHWHLPRRGICHSPLVLLVPPLQPAIFLILRRRFVALSPISMDRSLLIVS